MDEEWGRGGQPDLRIFNSWRTKGDSLRNIENLTPDAGFVFVHNRQMPGSVDILKKEHGSTNCLTDPVFGSWMHLQPDNAERPLWRKSHHVREIGIQRYQDAAVLNGESQDPFIVRS